jgi:hypothetical protein
MGVGGLNKSFNIKKVDKLILCIIDINNMVIYDPDSHLFLTTSDALKNSIETSPP